MARVTVEDCIDKVDSPYELVLVAKERATQLNSGVEPTLDRDNDKNTVISLREIAEGKVSVKTLEDAAINKLQKHQAEPVVEDSLDDEHDDNFDKLYKGEISKSGTAILPSKRIRRTPDNIIFDKKAKEDNDDNKDKVSDEESTEEKNLETSSTEDKSE